MTQTKEAPIDKKDTLQKVAETLTEKSTDLFIEVKPISKFEAWLIKRKIKPSKLLFSIRPQRVDNVYRIAGRVQKLNVDGIFNNVDQLGTMMKFFAEHGEDIFYIVAAAIQNNDQEPTSKMIRIVRRNFEMQDILTVMNVAVNNYNISAFINSIALMTGVDALKLKVSPTVNGG